MPQATSASEAGIKRSSVSADAPFPVSSSIRETCDHLSDSTGADCAELYELLNRMSAEQEDPTWARMTEAKLWSFLRSANRPVFSTRAIQCRSTVCVVEVEAAFGLGPFEVLSYEQATSLGMLHRDGVYGYENKTGAGRLRVRIQAFERRR